MKAILASLLLPLALIASASADWVLETKIESPQINTTSTTKVKDKKMRIDMEAGPAGAVSSIIDSATGDSIQLMHSQKMAMKMSAAQMKQGLDAAKKAAGGANDMSNVTFTPAGKETVNGIDCDIYTWTANGINARVWVAKNHPQAASLMQLEKSMKEGPLGKMQTGPDTTKLNGPTIKTEVVAGGTTTTTTVLSIKEQAVDAKDFEVPAGYQTMALPAGPGGN